MPPGGARPRAPSSSRPWPACATNGLVGRARPAARGGRGEPRRRRGGESFDASLVRVARRDWEKARRVPAELRAEIARGRPRSPSTPGRAPARVRLRRLPAPPRAGDRAQAPLRRVLRGRPPLRPAARRLRARDDDRAAAAAARASLREGTGPAGRARSRPRARARRRRCLHGEFPVAEQAALARGIAELLPLEPGAWRLDPTVHPFAIAIAISDLRITTRFDPGYVGTALWAVIHEVGPRDVRERGRARARAHAARPLGLARLRRVPEPALGELGRARPALPRLPAADPRASASRSGSAASTPDGLYRAANRVEPSLIRIEADEVTYNLHIVLRFELELELFEGGLAARASCPRPGTRDVAELPRARGPRRRPRGAPGRALGGGLVRLLPHLLARQRDRRRSSGSCARRAALGDLDAQLAAGELEPLRDLLRERIYRHGGKLLARRDDRRVVGGPLDTGPLLASWTRKYGELYGFDAAPDPA